MNKPFVAVMMGSDSDLPVMQSTFQTLDKLDVAWESKITSAHRTLAVTQQYVAEAERRGCAVFIAAAGLAAHLAGVVAGLTIKPVIGVPLESGPLHGNDALLSTVQMPGGIAVACMSIGNAGAKNAAYLAAQILALSDAELSARVCAEREQNANMVLAKDEALQESLRKK